VRRRHDVTRARQTGQPVRSSDCTIAATEKSALIFLEPKWSADNIITNPPYNCAEGFVASGVKHSNRKFALLLRPGLSRRRE